MSTVRLDKLLSNLGYGSRREIQQLAAAGRVRLDGAALAAADQRLALTPDLATRLTVSGRAIDPLPGVALMLHKPLGVTCSHKDDGPLVFELLPERWRRRDPAISTVGRLDKDTSGLLLLTDDGALLHRIISPRSHLPKRYRATLASPLTGDEAALFASGEMMLEGETRPLLPARLTVLDQVTAELTITEGRYHQVRRMFSAVGAPVATLHREAVGGLTLPSDLEAGRWRILGEADLRSLFGPPQD